MVKVRCPKCGTIFPPEAREVQICPRCGCAMRISKRPATAARYPAAARDDRYRPSQPPVLPERSGSGVYLSREEYENLLYKARMRRAYRDDRGYLRDGYENYTEDYAGGYPPPEYDTPREVYDYRRGYDRPQYRRPDEQTQPPVRERPSSVRPPEPEPQPEPEQPDNAVQADEPEPAAVYEPERVTAPEPEPEPVQVSEPEPVSEPAPEPVVFPSDEKRETPPPAEAPSPFAFGVPDRQTDAFSSVPPPPAAEVPVAESVPAPVSGAKTPGKAAIAVCVIFLLAAGVMNGLLLVLGVLGEGFMSLANALDLVTGGNVAQKITAIAIVALPVLAAVFGIIGAAARKKALMIVMGILLVIAFAATMLFTFLYYVAAADGMFDFVTYIQGNFTTQTVWVYIAAGLSLIGAVLLFVLAGKTKKNAA